MKLSLLVGVSLAISALALQPPALNRRSRTKSMLINPPGLPPLPSLSQATKAAAAASLNLDNVQGDILIGMKKNKELFFFFGIQDAAKFKTHLGANIHPIITTTTQLLSNSTQPTTLVNIAFSKAGLDVLGVTDSLQDSFFTAGQEVDAPALGDPGTANWVPQFLGKKVHGVFLLGSDTVANVNNELATIKNILGDSITDIYSLLGEARPGSEQGHEHFGFKDGIAQPAINGFNGAATFPGQSPLDAGKILLGQTGDSTTRPSWALEGSFLVFRQLKQLVPEFNSFLTNNALQVPGLTADEGAALLGARMVGRWKSGAPVDLAPLRDDPSLGSDKQRNNNFNFTHPGEDFTSNQSECPFSAHIRKTNPRADFANGQFNNHIIRAGIPYGPEVTDAEASSGTSDNSLERGLAFVAYQSSISVGFHTLQQTWANTPGFVFGKSVKQPGFDPIIGANKGAARDVTGLDPTNPTGTKTLQTDFVVSRGGEYFFSPSLDAILNTLAV